MRTLRPGITERNYAKEPLTTEEIGAILGAAGSIGAVMNTRHAIAKEKGWKEHPPDAATFTAAVLAEPNLLRRPILLHEGRVVVGTDEGALRALIG